MRPTSGPSTRAPFRRTEPDLLNFQLPIPRLSGRWFSALGLVKASIRKVITLEFVVPTLLAIALGVMLSVGAVYLIDNYLGPIDQAEAHYPAAGSD